MANGHGGYRKPANPAPVSGPGQHSRRTDGQPIMDMPAENYGDAEDMRQIQSGATMATDAAQGPRGPDPMAALAAKMQGLTGLGAPSEQPDVPVTDGADAGPGRGAGMIEHGLDYNQQDARHLARHLPVLIKIAERDDTAPGFKQWVRSIIANM